MKKKFARASRMVGLSFVIAGLLNWAALFAPAGGATWRAHHSMANTPTLAARSARPPAGSPPPERLCEQYNNLPLRFEAAAPQTNAPARFITHSGAHTVLLTASEAIVALRSRDASDEGSDRAGRVRLPKPVSSPDEREPQTTLVRWKLVGANAWARAAGLTELPGRNNHFIGNDPKRWRADVPAFARVQFACVYPGVDLVYYGSAGQLEYDFKVAPGASYESIRWRFSGAERLGIDESGSLVIDTPAGQIRHHKPLVYQLINGIRKEIAARYRIGRQQEVGFVIGDYDRRQALVIDPMLSISTYLGGVRSDSIAAVAVDAHGYAYIAGSTTSSDFPVTEGAVQSTVQFGSNSAYAYVAKFDPVNSRLLYCTFLGGSRFKLPGTPFEGDARTSGLGLAVDAAGNAYVTGQTNAVDFPTTPGCFQPNRAGQTDAFVVKLNAQGSALVYATYLGGNETHVPASFGLTSTGAGIAVDATGNAYVTGHTNADDFPTTANALKPTHPTELCLLGDVDPAVFPCTDAFVTKLNANGTALVYSTYLGGSGSDSGNGIAVDATGNACVVGTTEALNFPAINAAQPTRGGDADAFIARLNAQGSALIYSTYLGGAGRESGNAIALDAAGNAYVTGQTASTTLPVTAGALQSLNRSALLFKSTDGGDSWQPSSVGLLTNERLNRVAVDPADSSRVYVATGSIYLSGNSGHTWNRVGSPRNNSSSVFVFGFVFHSQNPAIIYALVDTSFPDFTTKVVRSTDGGQSWKDVTAIQRPGFVLDVTVAPSDTSVVYITTTTSLLRAQEVKDPDGFRIRDISDGLPGSGGKILAVHPRDSATLFATSPFKNYRLFKSTNGGNSWQAANLLGVPVFFVAYAPQAPRTVYAAGDSLFKSTDGGDSWQAIANDLPSIFFGPLTVDPLNASTLYTSTGDGLFKSIDGGKTWHVADTGLPKAGGYELAIDPKTSAILYAGRFNSGSNAFVAKLNPTGATFDYLTYLGGSQSDIGTAITVDAAGSAYVTGITYSKDFPLRRATQPDLRRPPSPDPGIPTGPDAFVARLDAAGAQLDFATYLGGGSVESGVAIAVDTAGNIFVAGNTVSSDFPVMNAFQSSYQGMGDGFLARIASAESNRPSPMIGSVMPTSAPSTGEVMLSISGANFAAGATASIGGVLATVVDVSDTTIKIIVPPNAPGTARVVVVNPDGQSAAFTNGFVYLASPEIQSVELGNKDLTVIGRNFDKGATILVNGKPQSTMASLAGLSGTVLLSAKGSKKIKHGQSALVQVRNANGLLSAPFSVTRPAD